MVLNMLSPVYLFFKSHWGRLPTGTRTQIKEEKDMGCRKRIINKKDVPMGPQEDGEGWQTDIGCWAQNRTLWLKKQTWQGLPWHCVYHLLNQRTKRLSELHTDSYEHLNLGKVDVMLMKFLFSSMSHCLDLLMTLISPSKQGVSLDLYLRIGDGPGERRSRRLHIIFGPYSNPIRWPHFAQFYVS